MRYLFFIMILFAFSCSKVDTSIFGQKLSMVESCAFEYDSLGNFIECDARDTLFVRSIIVGKRDIQYFDEDNIYVTRQDYDVEIGAIESEYVNFTNTTIINDRIDATELVVVFMGAGIDSRFYAKYSK